MGSTNKKRKEKKWSVSKVGFLSIILFPPQLKRSFQIFSEAQWTLKKKIINILPSYTIFSPDKTRVRINFCTSEVGGKNPDSDGSLRTLF